MLSTQLDAIKSTIAGIPKESWTRVQQELMQMINHVDNIDNFIAKANMDGGLSDLARIIIMPASMICPSCSHELVNCDECGRTTKKP